MRRSVLVAATSLMLLVLSPSGSAVAADCGNYEARVEFSGNLATDLEGSFLLRQVGSGFTYAGDLHVEFLPDDQSLATYSLADGTAFSSLDTDVVTPSPDPNAFNLKWSNGQIMDGQGDLAGVSGYTTGKGSITIDFETGEVSGAARVAIELCFGE